MQDIAQTVKNQHTYFLSEVTKPVSFRIQQLKTPVTSLPGSLMKILILSTCVWLKVVLIKPANC